jgi:hypothetical protein
LASQNVTDWSQLKLDDHMMGVVMTNGYWTQTTNEVDALNASMEQGVELIGEYSSVQGQVSVA